MDQSCAGANFASKTENNSSNQSALYKLLTIAIAKMKARDSATTTGTNRSMRAARASAFSSGLRDKTVIVDLVLNGTYPDVSARVHIMKIAGKLHKAALRAFSHLTT